MHHRPAGKCLAFKMDLTATFALEELLSISVKFSYSLEASFVPHTNLGLSYLGMGTSW